MYNFLSTCSGTHFVAPRAYRAELGIAFERSPLTKENRPAVALSGPPVGFHSSSAGYWDIPEDDESQP